MATLQAKSALVTRLLEAKKKSGKTYNQIAEQTGLTNAYVAQLFRRQAQLKPGTAKAFKAAVPTLTDDLIEAMQEIPLRAYDPIILQDPTIYRLVSLSLPHSSSCTIISCLCIISKYPAMSSKIVFLMFSHKTFIF